MIEEELVLLPAIRFAIRRWSAKWKPKARSQSNADLRDSHEEASSSKWLLRVSTEFLWHLDPLHLYLFWQNTKDCTQEWFWIKVAWPPKKYLNTKRK